MSYRDTLNQLSDQTTTRVVAVFERWQTGEIDHDEALALIAAVIARANGTATALADLSLAATLMRQLRRPVPTVGVLPAPDEPERLSKSATTLLAVSGVTVARVARLARSEVLSAAADAYSTAIAQQPLVTGWTRNTGGEACKVCTDLADGSVLPNRIPMWHHPGCTCTQQPVTEERA